MSGAQIQGRCDSHCPICYAICSKAGLHDFHSCPNKCLRKLRKLLGVASNFPKADDGMDNLTFEGRK